MPNSDSSRARRRLGVLVVLGGTLLFYGGRTKAQAAPPPTLTTLPPVAVTAARTPQPLTELLADLTVIDRDEIARSGDQSLAQLLQRQPGVEVQQFGGPGGTSGVFLRGANTAQTLVLVDGVRVASATAGTTALEAIPLEQIDRIEILRGPASSLYGADAIGGVIQVFTRRSGQGATSANASIGYGSFNTLTATAGVAGSFDRGRYAVQVSGRHSDGFNAIVNPANFSYDPDRDSYRQEAVNLSGGWTLAAGHELSAQYFRSRLNSRFDAGDAFDDRTITTLQSWQLAAHDRWSANWTTHLAAAEGRDDSVSHTGFGQAPFRTAQRQYAWQNEIALPAGALTAALERREERITTDAPFAITGRDTNAATAIYQWAGGAHAFQANVRHDDSSQYGGRTTGALAYGYRIAPEWRMTLGAGNAFKAPTFNDLYFPGFSNPGLRPETSRNVEGGLHWSGNLGAAAVQARMLAWYTRVRELIVFGCDENFVCVPRNVAEATLKGLTFGGETRWRDTTLRGSIDVQSPRDDATDHLLPRRAGTHGGASLLQRWGPAVFGAEVVASSHRYDDPANARRLGGYAIVNMTAEWSLQPGISLFVRGDNVLAKDYQLAADYATGGARVFGGVRWQL